MHDQAAEWRWVQRYAEQFQACNLQPGEVVVLLSEASSKKQIVETARMALEIATLGGAACLGRTGELGTLVPGAVGDVAIWSLEGPLFAGAIADPIEAWLRCGPVAARHTVVHGRPVVRDGHLVSGRVDEMLHAHERLARRLQAG